MLEAITFDFWDTIAIDDSDEPKRRALGLPSKADARIELFASHVTQRHPQIAHEQAVRGVPARAPEFSAGVARGAADAGHGGAHVRCLRVPGAAAGSGRFAQLMREVDALVREIETMEVRIQPDFTPACMRRSRSFRLTTSWASSRTRSTRRAAGCAICCSGRACCAIQLHALFRRDRRVQAGIGGFPPGCARPGAAPHQIVHIGDRESNDVAVRSRSA